MSSLWANSRTQRLEPATAYAILRMPSAKVNAAKVNPIAKAGGTVADVDTESGERSPGEPLAVPTRLGARSDLRF